MADEKDLTRLVAERSRLKVLIWGPAEGRDLYEKREQIRIRIRELGHHAEFSEDVLAEQGAEELGIGLDVAELIQVLAYDYIVCLMVSPGSIAEFHLFGQHKKIAPKMLVCVDSSHKGGFATSHLSAFEGAAGKVDWYETPQDLDECHLASRAVAQVKKLAARRQWEVALSLMDEL